VGKWKKEKTPPQHLVWFGFISKTVKTNSSTTSAFMGVGSQQPPGSLSLLLYHNTEQFQHKFFLNLFCQIFEKLFIICAKILINQKFNCQVWIVDLQAQKLQIEIV
jgi:hypothetical protein